MRKAGIITSIVVLGLTLVFVFLYDAPKEPVRSKLILIDISYSMRHSQQPFEEGFGHYLGSLVDGTRLSVTTFSSKPSLVWEGVWESERRDSLASIIPGLRFEGKTDFDALFSYLKEKIRREHITDADVIIYSDGWNYPESMAFEKMAGRLKEDLTAASGFRIVLLGFHNVEGTFESGNLRASSSFEYAEPQVEIEDTRPWWTLSIPLSILLLSIVYSVVFPQKEGQDRLLVVSDGQRAVTRPFVDGSEVRFSRRIGAHFPSSSEGRIVVRNGSLFARFMKDGKETEREIEPFSETRIGDSQVRVMVIDGRPRFPDGNILEKIKRRLT